MHVNGGDMLVWMVMPSNLANEGNLKFHGIDATHISPERGQGSEIPAASVGQSPVDDDECEGRYPLEFDSSDVSCL